MGARVVVLENPVPVGLEKGQHMRVQHLVHVPLRCDAVAASRTKALEDDGSQHLVVADGAPQHEAGPAPGVVLHDTVVSIAVSSSSPYPNTPVGMVDAETAFIAEKHVLPANIVPIEVALRPLQACLSMAHGEDGSPGWTAVSQPPGAQSPAGRLPRNGCLVCPYNSSGCFCSCSEGISNMDAENVPILPWRRHSGSAVPLGIGSSTSCHEPLLETINGGNVAMETRSHGFRRVPRLQTSNGPLALCRSQSWHRDSVE